MSNVLITGCSSGIGRALAFAFHKAGYCVWATARHPETLSELDQQGMKIGTLDVTSKEQVNRVLENIAAAGGIDILVNNAGYGAMGAVLEIPDPEIRQQFETNVFAPLQLIQAVAPQMIARGSGTVINIGSVSGDVITPFSGTYCASKSAFNVFSDTLRIELAPLGVEVMTVKPGAIRSSFADNARKALERALPENSFYRPIEAALWKRAGASQNNPADPEVLAEKVVSCVKSGNASGSLYIGNGAYSLRLLRRLLPETAFEWVMSRVFHLNRLKR